MKVFKRLLAMLKPYAFFSALALLFTIIFTGVEYVSPLILRQIIDLGISKSDVKLVGRLVLLMAVLNVGRSVAAYFQGYFMERSSQNIAYDLRNKLYTHLQSLSFSFFDRQQTGQLMSRMTGDIECVRAFLGFGFINLLMCFITFAYTITVFLQINWKMALLVLIPTPLLIISIAAFGKKIHPAWEVVREQMGKLTAVLQENVTGIRVVKAFAREQYEKGKFNNRNIENFQKSMERAGIEANAFPLMDFLSGLNFILLTFFGGYYIIKGEITIGTFMALQWYSFGLIWPVRFSGWLINIMQQAIAAAPRIFEILDTKPQVCSKPDAVKMPSGRGSVLLDNINYDFPDGQPALKNINLEVQPGEIIAIIGGTGSGKSTLIGLITRFFDPSEGRVLIDGTDIRDVTLESLRSRIGIVMQETFLFSDTIRENIAYGRPDATQEEIEEAAKTACIHDFILSLPDGYSTRVGERGIGLSGGQKQRVAIARAVLVNPAILVFDEATSSVDTATERAIQASLRDIMKGRTTFIIAQRLSTVKYAGRIVVLENGEIVEVGTHSELIGRGGYYSRIYELQFKGQEIPGQGDFESL